jgi:hypothetical protein
MTPEVKCRVCGRPRANEEDWHTYGEGEGTHLCWDGMDADCVERDWPAELERLKAERDAALDREYGTSDDADALRAEVKRLKAEVERIEAALREYAREESCPDCDGTGDVLVDGKYERCDWCGGTGFVSTEDAWDDGTRARAALRRDKP